MQETAGKRDDLLTQVREAQEERLRLQKRATEVSAESAKLSEEMVILGEEVNSLRVRAGNLSSRLISLIDVTNVVCSPFFICSPYRFAQEGNSY